MSPLNVLPSGPPEKLYLELPRDNFRLSRIGNIEKQISEEIENYRKVNKKYIKAQTAIALHRHRFELSLGRSYNHWRRLDPYWPWNYHKCTSWCCCRFLRRRFCCAHKPEQKAQSESDKTRKKFTHCPLPNTTPLMPLFPRV